MSRAVRIMIIAAVLFIGVLFSLSELRIILK